MKRTIIFDLDGTLVDIEPLFTRITNQLAAEFHFQPIKAEDLPKLKEMHLARFLWERLGIRIALFPFFLKRGREEYHRLLPEVLLFPGIRDVISALRDQGYSTGVVSSSRVDTIHAVLQKFGLEMDFVIQCGIFTKGRALRKALSQHSLSPEKTVYVGDEVRDVEACQKAGIKIIAVTWGLNSQEALEKAGAETVSTREALLERLLAR